MKQKLIKSIITICLLCIGLVVKAQPPASWPISGRDTVCLGDTARYWITPLPMTTGFIVNSNGTILSASSTVANVIWIATGNGQVIMNGYDDAHGGTHLYTDTYNVYVMPLPAPIVTTKFRVQCQQLGHTDTSSFVGFDTSKCNRVCSNNCVIYHAHGGAGSTYNWTAVGGTVSLQNADSCVICWGTPGFGSITVVETNSHGCMGKRTYCTEIIESPIAHFVTMPDTTLRSITICDSTDVIFLDKSNTSASSQIVSWHWDFGDGHYLNASSAVYAPVTHQYTVPGVYMAKLTVTNKCGCATTDSIEVHVDANVRLKIECPRVACEGDTTSYSVNTTCTTGSWSVIGGTIIQSSPTTVAIKWNSVGADGIGYVMFDATACGLSCAFVTVKVPVLLNTGTIDGPAIVCPYGNYVYKLPQWPGTSYTWSVSGSTGAFLSNTDQPNEAVLYTQGAGTITLNCNYTNGMLGCSGTAALTVTVLDTVTVSGPLKVCYKTNATYALSGAATGNWVLLYPDLVTQQSGTGNTFTQLFDQVGPYILTVTGSAFCPPAPITIIVDPLPPIPDTIIGPDTFCKGVPVRFQGGNEIFGTIFNWAMTNGTVNIGSGSESDLTMKTSSSGPFIIYLWRETKDYPFCKSDTLTKTVAPPVINLAIAGNIAPCVSTFATYSAGYTDGESYEWRIFDPLGGSVQHGDGSPNVSILWNNDPDTFLVTCKMRKCFVDYFDTLVVIVNGVVTPTFNIPSTVCAFDSFNVTVTNGEGVFDFYDATGPHTTSGGSYRYVYGHTSGSLPVLVTLTPSGCGSANPLPPVLTSITVNGAPFGDVTPHITVACSTVSQVLTYALTSPISTTPSMYQWYYQGFAITGATSSTYTATAFGYYWVVVTATNGCTWRSDSTFVWENCPCPFWDGGADITSATNDNCNQVHFTAAHTYSPYFSYSWDFGDIPTITSVSDVAADGSVSHAGTYPVMYIVQYNFGEFHCSDTVHSEVTVPYIPQISISHSCLQSSSGRWATITSNYMDILDVYIDDMVTPVATGVASWSGYLAPGRHDYKITSGGCESTLSDSVFAQNAAFSFLKDTTCAVEAPVLFTNTSAGMGGFTSLWDFDDGAQNTQKDPARVYAGPSLVGGVYDVKLVITDAWGCKDSVTHPVPIVKDSIEGTLAASPTDACQHQFITMTYTPKVSLGFPGYPDVYQFVKDRDYGVAPGHSPYASDAFTSGMYWVHGTNHYGCVANTNAVTINIFRVPKPYISGDPDVCVNVPYTLSGYAGSDPNINYKWLLNNVLVSAATNPLLPQVQATAGTYVYRVILDVTNPLGGSCPDTSDPYTVTVHALPAPPEPAFTITDCEKYEIELTASHPSAATETFNWSNGLSGTPAYAYEGGAYQLVFTDRFGCTSDSDIFVPKDPREYLWIFPSGCWSICPPQPYSIYGPIIEFEHWDYLKKGFPPVLSGTSSIPSTYLNLAADAPGIFNLYLDNGICNATSDDMIVDVNCIPYIIGHKPGLQQPIALQPLLTLVPNPAKDAVRISYSFTNEKTERYLEVYDMTGRLADRYRAATLQGNWYLPLEKYMPGVYQVVLKQDKETLLAAKLSVVK